MAVNEISGVVLPLVACVVVAAGFGWQMLRRRNRKVSSPKPSRVQRDANGHVLPNAQPSEGAVKKPQAVNDFDSVGVKRPTMLAVTAMRGDTAASELFIQRAFKIDRAFWHELEVSFHEMRRLDCLFAEANKLAWVPGSAFERHIFAVSFSPVLEEALKQGYHPRVNATAADLQIVAIDETGRQLGEPMQVPDYAWGEPARVHALWCALNPADKPHELEGELVDELGVLKERVAALTEHVAALTARNWQQRFDRLFDISEDLRRIGAEGGQAAERHVRIDDIVNEVRGDAKRIDDAVAERARTVESIEDADDALMHAIAYLYVRELTVRMLRVCALLRVMAGDTFAREVHCANHIISDLDEFTDVRALIVAAAVVAHAPLESENHRAMSDGEVERAGAIARHSRELERLHDTLEAQLREQALDLQAKVDKCLLWQSHPRRYAVRIDDTGHLEKMFVLDA